MRTIAMAMLLVLAPRDVQAAQWRTITNDRFGFAVDLPASYEAWPPPANGDGLPFTSPDGRSEIVAYGHRLDGTPAMVDDGRRQAAFETEKGVRLTYRQVSPEAYTLSGFEGDRIVYMHAVETCAGAAAAIVRAEYPAADKLRMDATIAHVARTLRGSSACRGPRRTAAWTAKPLFPPVPSAGPAFHLAATASIPPVLHAT